jgi:hypothetical protein
VSGAGEEGMFKEGQCSGHKRALEKSQSHQVLDETVGALSKPRIVAPTLALDLRVKGALVAYVFGPAALGGDLLLQELDDCSRRANECGAFGGEGM